MAKTAMYDRIDKYSVLAVCEEPFHVGSASGDGGEILIHPVDNIPFIQASGICGVLRSHYTEVYGQEKANILFGDHEQNLESRIRFSDGEFVKNDNLHIELRPRVKMNPKSGTVAASTLKGTSDRESGNKFDMQYVGAGAEFSFDIYLYGGEKEENQLIQKCLAALNAGEIQFGGQKSNGCGYVTIEKILHRTYDMRNASDRRMWRDESELEEISLPDLKPEDRRMAYEIKVMAATENELLVKGIAIEDFGKDAPKATNIKNAKGKYIIPGSSFKGSVRNRMSMIAEYMGLNKALIYDGFGKMSDTNESGMTGNLRFRDTIVKNGKDAQRTRIRIDKFTGGVMNGGLFSELNVTGDLDITIQIENKNHPDAVAGLVLLALRDLGCQLYALGGGQNVGKGYVNIKGITVENMKKNRKCHLDSSFVVDEKGRGVIDDCMKALGGQAVS